MAEQEIKFKSENLQLFGTLMLPDSGESKGTVLLIAGSGQVDRNENHKRIRISAFKEIAEYLAKHRIATFRYDKRGVGLSEGDYFATGFFDNVSDASAALTHLKSHPQIGTKPVFILGHSEGALICTRLAAERSDIAGAVLVAGAAVTGESILRWQAREVAKSLGGFNGFIIKLFRIDIVKSQAKFLNKIKQSNKNYMRQGFNKINAKWFREFMAYDPALDMPKIKVPVLAITGSKDIQVNPADLKKMSELIKSQFEYDEIPDMTHLLREEKGKATLSTYQKQVKQPLDPRLLQLIGDWLTKHTANQK